MSTPELLQAQSEAIYFRALLRKYIKHVLDYGGTDFLDDHCRHTPGSEFEASSLTDREWESLIALRKAEM